MKKIIALSMFVVLSSSSFAFAAVLASNTASGESVAIYAGNSKDTAEAAKSPQIKLSSKVAGIVNFTATAANSLSYAIGTKHTAGSRIFGAASDSTTIFYKLNASGNPLTGTDFGDKEVNANFAGGGWTAQ